MSFYKIKSKLLSFFSDIRIYPGGIILAGDSHYKMKGLDMRAVLNNLQAGDIMLRRYSHYLGSVLIKGYFSHAAIYVGENNVIHMLGEGITEEDILTFMRCDDMAILRYRNASKVETAINRAKKLLKEGIDYDYNFDTESSSKFYCTEFVDSIFDYPIRDSNKDKKIILPDDYLDCLDFRLIWRKE
jgi:uncharacterized protein YycO